MNAPLFIRSKLTLLASFFVALGFGAQAAALPPADCFRLTVEEVVQSANCRVVKLQIVTRSAQMMQLTWDNGAQMSTALSWGRKGKSREGTAMVASMLGEGFTVCHTTIEMGGCVMPWSCEVPRGAEVRSVVSLSITNGTYKLDQRLAVGTTNGEKMWLTVGKWN